MALLDKSRRALAAEGLFDEARKRRLPFAPRVIGVVTSPTGAVIRDIIHRLEDRFPTHVILWPVPVQGEGAADKIAAAIAGFNALPAAARPPDRRARRRLDRGFVGVQRGGRGARRRRLARSRSSRRSATRPTPRSCDFAADRARADADRRRRDGGAGARRTARPGPRARRAAPSAARGARPSAPPSSCRLLRHWPEREALLAPQQQRLDDLAERLPRALERPARPGAGRARPRRRRASPGLLDAAHRRGRRTAGRLVAGGRARPSRTAARARLCPGRGSRRAHDPVSAAAAREARRLRLIFGDGAVEASVGGTVERPTRDALS